MNPRQDCPGGVEWDRFVLDPSIQEHAEMEKHLEVCAYCRVVVSESKRVWGEALAGIESQTTGRGLTAGIVVLEAIPGLTPIPRVSALAAKGISGESEPTSLTLASQDRSVWLHVVRDKRSRDVWLYLLSEESSASPANAMVRPFDMAETFITDEQGRVNLGPTVWPAGETIKAEVMFPKTSFRLSEVREKERPTGQVLLKSESGDEIMLSWAGEEHHRRLTVEVARLTGMSADAPIKLAVRSTGQTRPLHVATIPLPGTIGLDSESDLATLEIFIYQ